MVRCHQQSTVCSEIAPSELEPQFDETSSPQCTYSIRKGSFDGPEVHAAVVGETGESRIVVNLRLQSVCSRSCLAMCKSTSRHPRAKLSCRRSPRRQNFDHRSTRVRSLLLNDQNIDFTLRCGIDNYLFRTPQYSADLQTAFLVGRSRCDRHTVD